LPRSAHTEPNPPTSQSGSSEISTLESSTFASSTGSTDGAGAVGVAFGFGSSAFCSGVDEHDPRAASTAAAIVMTSGLRRIGAGEVGAMTSSVVGMRCLSVARRRTHEQGTRSQTMRE
jgi:hypothetical protein